MAGLRLRRRRARVWSWPAQIEVADMAEDHSAPRSRRALLAAAAGGAAALAATAALPLSVAAADPNDVVKEVDNPTTAPTTITNATADSLAFGGSAAGQGVGVQGTSTGGPGLYGWSVTPSPTDPTTLEFTGVYGWSPAGTGDLLGAGVWGDSEDVGIFGTGPVGVMGIGAIGVVAMAGGAPTDIALEVEGKVLFSRSGRSTIGANKSSIKINLAGTSNGSRVFAVLHSNRSGRYVRAVVPTAGSFTIYLNTAVTSATHVAWFVIN